MKFILSTICLFSAFTALAQKDSFDLASYTVPSGWTKEVKENLVSYSLIDRKKGSWSQIGVIKSTISKGDINTDFDSEWQDLVVKSYNVKESPQMNEVQEADGWKIKAGAGKFSFNNSEAMVMLTSISGFNRVMSIVCTTNSQDYLKEIESFLSSVDLKKPTITTPPSSVGNDGRNSMIGTWGANASDNSNYRMKNGIMNYISRQYTFNTDGTYRYVSKAFDPLMDKILLGKENGTYVAIGNSITVTPKKSILEAWSKKDGGDSWGKLISSQVITLEKATYQFAKYYMAGVQEWNLVLQSSKATQRDGPFSSNTTFTNGWYYRPISNTSRLIEYPVREKEEVIKEVPVAAAKAAKSDSFHFTTSNFDNGWTSTVQEDWVQVTKGDNTVLIHYPNKKADEYNSVLMDGLKTAWNILVAPRYSSASSLQFKPVSSWQSIEFAEDDLVEKSSGKTVHVVFFKKNFSGGEGKYMEFIAPDKATFEKEFGIYSTESYAPIWDKMAGMAGYNKFAVAPSDLKGKWTSNFSGIQQYVNAYTGASAGMDTHSSAQVYIFGDGSTFKWNLSVASGFVGSIKFQNVKSEGTFSLPSNCQIHFSDLEGKPKTYGAFFSCIKGARILWIDGTAFGKDSTVE